MHTPRRELSTNPGLHRQSSLDVEFTPNVVSCCPHVWHSSSPAVANVPTGQLSHTNGVEACGTSDAKPAAHGVHCVWFVRVL
tara:strand:- start:351 stop:596 length:246 start_codon:yes stop_codon:yes gene_type:complete